MQKIIHNEKELEILAKDLINQAKENQINLICFFAELGAGKTTFSKYIAKELGVKENIISPTFVILKEYKTKDPIFKKLVHIDAYRLKDESDAKIFKLSDYLQKDNIVLLEWAENFKNLPRPRIDIKIQVPNNTILRAQNTDQVADSHTNLQTRIFTFNLGGETY